MTREQTDYFINLFGDSFREIDRYRYTRKTVNSVVALQKEALWFESFLLSFHILSLSLWV